jgi:peptidyl-prolyl cis-trans isomerase B (cyclophilin B)
METSKGTIKIELYPDKAPITVKNFLQYVKDKHYRGLLFHRVIPNFMIQGGGMEPGLNERKARDPIKNESSNGLSNKRGTIAMARAADPDSATSQFFINVKDNVSLDKGKMPGNMGYCVFGRVIEGMDVVDKIKDVATHALGAYRDVPVEDVAIKSVRPVR